MSDGSFVNANEIKDVSIGMIQEIMFKPSVKHSFLFMTFFIRGIFY